MKPVTIIFFYFCYLGCSCSSADFKTNDSQVVQDTGILSTITDTAQTNQTISTEAETQTNPVCTAEQGECTQSVQSSEVITLENGTMLHCGTGSQEITCTVNCVGTCLCIGGCQLSCAGGFAPVVCTGEAAGHFVCYQSC